MKILLIQPPIRDFYQTAIRTQPIGLAYLAASLRSLGHEIEILDCQTGRKKSIPVPPELHYLRDFYPFDDRSPFRLYSGYYQFGLGSEEIRQRIEASKADVFGISSSFTPYHPEALEVARIIKTWDSRKTVVMGGAHVSCNPEGVLQSLFVDYAILGEGEVRFPWLLQRMVGNTSPSGEKMDGIGYRMNGGVRIHPLENFIRNLDEIAFPARDILCLDRYAIGGKRSTMIITSRGCPHRCAYCSSHLLMGSSFRTRSPENILSEVTECVKRYDIQRFDIEDDNFTYDQARAKTLMRLMIEAFGERRLELSAMNGISFASLDIELLRLMKRGGFDTVNLSYVSTAASTKEKMERPGLTTDFDEVLKNVEEAQLRAIAYGILGMPGQTLEEMTDTLIYLMGKRVLIGPSVYYPTPKTRLYERCREEGVLPVHPLQWRSTALPIETKDFNRTDILTLIRLARLINFIKGKIEERSLPEGITWRELRQFLRDRKGDRGRKGNRIEISWTDLILMLFDDRSFFGLKKGPGRELSLLRLATSTRVLSLFFERTWERPILPG